MSDKFINTAPGLVHFVAGEQPLDLKFNNWAQQTKDALTAFEMVLGNAWNSDPNIAIKGVDPHPLFFTNLSRYVGNAELLNPQRPYGQQYPRHAQLLEAGQTEHILDYWIDLDNTTITQLLAHTYATGSNAEALDSSIILDSDHCKITVQEVQNPGDWTIIGRTLYLATPAAGDYFIFDGIWLGEDIARSFTCIPYSAQIADAAGSGIAVTKIVDTETYYTLTMPTYSHDYDGTLITTNQFQIPIPTICQYANNVQIPEGLVTLWDLGDPPVIVGAQKINATFYGTGDAYAIIAKNCSLAENNRRYMLVCAGEGLGWAVRKLRDICFSYLDGDPTKSIHDLHAYLRGLRFTGRDIDGNVIAGAHIFGRSIRVGNDHSQYLHRDGYDPNDPAALYNAILGDILLASLDPSSGYVNLNGNSVKLLFGSTDGPEIYYDSTAKQLVIRGQHDGNGAGVKIGKTDDGVQGNLSVENDILPGGKVDTLSLAEHNHSGTNGMGEFAKIAISSTDALPGLLIDKFTSSPTVEIIRVNEGGNEKLQFKLTGGSSTVKTYSVPGTYTYEKKDPDITQLIIEVYGSGGGGTANNPWSEDGSLGFLHNGTGGAGGGYARTTIDAAEITTVSVTVGAGGGPGYIGGFNSVDGIAGGVTSFGSYISATGGGGGRGPTDGGFYTRVGSATALGGTGIIATSAVGDIIINGEDSLSLGGVGGKGAGPLGNNGGILPAWPVIIGGVSYYNQISPGNPGGSPGGGGGCGWAPMGVYDTPQGGTGGNGLVIITEVR